MNNTDAFYALIQKAQKGDTEAKNTLLSENMGLVYRVSSRFYGRGAEKEDLNQIGAIGLLRAIERFDTSLGLAFSTFAVPQILGEIRQFLRSDGLIKVSRDLKKTALEIRRAVETLEAENGTAPTLLEIAKALSLSLEAVTEAIDATAPVSSISSEQNAIEKAAPFVSSFENKTLERLDIQNAIKSLPEREQTLLFMRYVQEKTQTEIAKALCLSQVQISRMEKKILVRLKEILSYAENSAVS